MFALGELANIWSHAERSYYLRENKSFVFLCKSKNKLFLERLQTFSKAISFCRSDYLHLAWKIYILKTKTKFWKQTSKGFKL